MARTPTPEAQEDDRPPSARLFVALDLADDARTRLAEWRARALSGRSELRLTPEDSLHVTLVFLGHRPESQIAAVAETTLRAVDGLVAPELVPRRMVDVPRRRPRLVALDLGDPAGAAAAVQAAVAGALAAAGLQEPESRPFWPHVTLARVPRARARSGRARSSSHSEGRSPPASLGFDRVTLYRSHLSPAAGARYEPIAGRGLSPR